MFVELTITNSLFETLKPEEKTISIALTVFFSDINIRLAVLSDEIKGKKLHKIIVEAVLLLKLSEGSLAFNFDS